MELAMKLTQVMQRMEAQRVGEHKVEEQSQKLLEEIREIKQEIACNEGWFSMELDEDLIEKLRVLAEDCDRSLSQYINLILKEYLAKQETKEEE